MVLRSLQPKIARHIVGIPLTYFDYLVLDLYDVEDGIYRGLWTDSSPIDVKEKKPFRGQRSVDVSVISYTSQRPLRRHSSLGLALFMHLNSIGHKRLFKLMIGPTRHLHYHCLTMPPRA